MARSQCRPFGGGKVHCLWKLGDYVFCIQCGAHSARRAIGISSVCNGWPKSDSAGDRRVRLSKGRHPITNEELGIPAPILMWDEWHELIGDVEHGGLDDFPELRV